MGKNTYVMLAHKYDSTPHGGWFMSEKLDGMRCIWDGGCTRGMAKSDVPWANCDKDGRYVTPPIATGLWSRLGNVIHAPDSWIDKLPKIPLDGELYTGNRQELMSCVKKLVPDEYAWEEVEYKVFDMVPMGMFSDILIPFEYDYMIPAGTPFMSVVTMMQRYIPDLMLPQQRLPFESDAAELIISTELERITTSGGEGLMLRYDQCHWHPERTHSLQKVKKLDDAEGTVVGYTAGRQTDKGSKLLGMMGALILDVDGKRLELSGFTEDERMLCSGGCEWALENPEQELPLEYTNLQFPRGSRVTFRYRGLSNDGIPNEARYWRKHE